MVQHPAGREWRNAKPTDNRLVWFGGLPPDVRQQTIQRAIERFGEVEDVETGLRGDVAFALFADARTAADCAAGLNGTSEIVGEGNVLEVRLASSKIYIDAGGTKWQVPPPAARGRVGNRNARNSDNDDGQREHIQRLIEERNNYRRRREWAPADQIREDLRAMGVDLDDKGNTWTEKGGLTGKIRGDPPPPPPPPPIVDGGGARRPAVLKRGQGQLTTFRQRNFRSQVMRRKRAGNPRRLRADSLPPRSPGSESEDRRDRSLSSPRRRRQREPSETPARSPARSRERSLDRSRDRSRERSRERSRGRSQARSQQRSQGRSATQSPRRAEAAAAALAACTRRGVSDDRSRRSPSRSRSRGQKLRRSRSRSSRSRRSRSSRLRHSRSRRSRSSASSRNARSRSRGQLRPANSPRASSPNWGGDASPRDVSASPKRDSPAPAQQRDAANVKRDGASPNARRDGLGQDAPAIGDKRDTESTKLEPAPPGIRGASTPAPATDSPRVSRIPGPSSEAPPAVAGARPKAAAERPEVSPARAALSIEQRSELIDGVPRESAPGVADETVERVARSPANGASTSAPTVVARPTDNATSSAVPRAAPQHVRADGARPEASRNGVVPSAAQAKATAGATAAATNPAISRKTDEAEVEKPAPKPNGTTGKATNTACLVGSSAAASSFAVPAALERLPPPAGASNTQMEICASVVPSDAFAAGSLQGVHDNTNPLSVSGGGLPNPEYIRVALSFQGKRKVMKHLSSTRVGELVDSQRNVPEGLVLVDRDGDEIGREFPLEYLARQAGIGRGGSTGPLELTLQVDEFAG